MAPESETRPFWMTAKRDGKCWECFGAIIENERIVWNPCERRAYCQDCGPDVAGPDPAEES